MRAILKYPLRLDPHPQRVAIPVDAYLVACAVQNGVPTMWWSAPFESRDVEDYDFVIVATGQGYDDELTHVFSFLVDDGAFVGHVLCEGPVARSAAEVA